MVLGDGSAATSAGMDVVIGSTTPAATIDTEITKTRDYIALGYGGVVAATPDKAVKRDAFGRAQIATPNAAADIANKGYVDGKASWASLDGKPTYVGAGSTQLAARTAIGIPEIAAEPTGNPSTLVQRWSNGRMSTLDPTGPLEVVNQQYLGARIGPGSSVAVYLGHARSNPVSSSYVAAYLNGDGRIGATPSALRFKKEIQDYHFTVDQLRAIRVVSYRLKAAVYGNGDAPRQVGVIAEELIAAGLEEFVVFDDDGEPFSVAYERLALVAISALQDVVDVVDDLAGRVAQLEGKES